MELFMNSDSDAKRIANQIKKNIFTETKKITKSL